jgi:1,4-dihydroxy-2-naphthoyl-CoA hydrolase
MTKQPDGPAAQPLAELSQLLPFAQTLGAVIESADASAVTGILEWAPGLCTTGGALHGGALMGLADNLGGLCAYLNLPEGAATATIESKTNFFRGVRAGRVRGTARPLHVGRTTIVVETDLRDDAGRRVALTIQTQAVLRPPPQ